MNLFGMTPEQDAIVDKAFEKKETQMTHHQIAVYLEANPKTFCWLDFGTGMIRLANGEGLILLRCMSSRLVNPDRYKGPTRCRATFRFNSETIQSIHFDHHGD